MELFFALLILLFSVVVHEVAHAWQARREGDDTAEKLGRITLNPIPHLDPVGSIIVPVILWLGPGSFIFGWAKPVPVNPANFRDYRAGDIRVSLAGIVSNLLLAAGFTLLAVPLTYFASGGGISGGGIMAYGVLIARFGIFINLILAFFNLIPIPPLDGSHVLYHLLPESLKAGYRRVGAYGIGVLLILFFLVPGVFSLLLWPVDVLMSMADAFIDLWI